MHGLTSMTLGVPDVDAVASYYEDFGLRRVGDRPDRGLVLATTEGGEQLALRPSERRRLLEIGIGADDPDDLSRIEASLRRLGVEFERDAGSLRVRDPNSALQVSVQVGPRITEAAAKQEPANGPGRADRIGSNFFWYLKDPVGNFSEYYSDLDIILDDQLWKPSVVEGARGLYNWGPPPPPSFIQPEDLAALMTGSHAPRA
jgi:catechol 2,3-dioxygenase-like lactoylglutathione lyase family enzyme